MSSRIIDTFLQNRKIILGVFALLCAAGAYSMLRLPVDAVPDVTNVQVMVVTKTGALDPVKVERTVTFYIETQIRGIAQIEEIRSISKYGLSLVTVIFKDGTDVYWARQQVNERLQGLRGQLPDDITPEMAPMFTGLGEVFFYVLLPVEKSELAAKSLREQLTYLRTVQDYIVKPQLKLVPGVADVDTFGGYSREIHITINPGRLEAAGLTIENLVERLHSVGENFGGGYVQREGRQIIIRTLGRINTSKQIALIPVRRTIFGHNILLGDVCEIKEMHSPPLGAASYRGQEAVIGMPMMMAGSNSRNVAIDLNRAVANLELPDDTRIETLYSRDFLVNSTIRTVAKNLAEGAGFVVVVLLLVLGNIRAAVIVSLAIPISMLMAFIGMNFFKISGNLMSLGAIDFGLLVDGSVVMFENMIRRMEENRKELSFQEKFDLIKNSTLETLKPVSTALILIMGVFLPLLALEGVEGKMFGPMAKTVLLALVASLIVALVLMPVLGLLFLKVKITTGNHESHNEHMPFFLKGVLRGYRPVLEFCLRRKIFIVGFSGALTVLSAIMFARMGGDFVPQLDEGDMVINLTRSVSAGINSSIDATKRTEEIIAKFPEVERVFSRLGVPDSATDPSGVYFGDTFVILKKDRSTWRTVNGRRITKEQLFEEMRKAITSDSRIPEQEISMTQPIEMRFNEMLEGSRADVTMRIYGPDLTELYRLVHPAKSLLEKMEGVESVSFDPLTQLSTGPILDIQLDYPAIAYYGLSIQDVNEVMETAMSGRQVGNLYESRFRFPIVLRLDDKLRNDYRQIASIPVGFEEGGSIPLGRVTTLAEREEVTNIARSQGKRYAAISIYLGDIDIETFVSRAQEQISNNLKLPEDYSISWGGQYKNLQRAKERLAWIVPATLTAIFLVLLYFFKDYRQSLLVYSGIPLSAMGGIITLGVTGINFSISAAVGFIALMGISILNGLVLITHYDERRKHSPETNINQIVFEGSLERFRPVVITTLVAGLGFLPMALNSGLGSEVQKPLATVVIGGLILSTILTALLLPSLYAWTFRKGK